MNRPIGNNYPNLMQGKPVNPEPFKRTDPAYQAALADVREWVYVYLLTLVDDARQRSLAAKAEGRDRKFLHLAGAASAYHRAALGVFIDQHLTPEMVSHAYDDGADAALGRETVA